MIPKAEGIVLAAHFVEQERFHLGELVGIGRVLREVSLHGVRFAVLSDEFFRIGGEVEKLGLAHVAVHDVILDELPVALFHAAHAGARAAAIDAVEDIAHGFLFAFEHGLEAGAFDGLRGRDAREIAERGQHVEKVNIARCTRARLDAGTFDDHGHAQGVLVEVLFPLKAVATDRDAVIGGVEDVGVVEFTHGFEFREHAGDLSVDVLRAGHVAPALVADGGFVPPLPNAFHTDLVAQSGMTVEEGMLGQVIQRQGRLQGVQGWDRLFVGVIDRAVLRIELRFAVARIVRVREAEVDEERVGVLGGLAVIQVVQHLVGMPGAAFFILGAVVGAIMAHGELLIGGLVAVPAFAGAHGVVASGIEDGGHGEFGQIRRHALCVARVGIAGVVGLVRDVPDVAPAHDHVTRRRAHTTGPRSHVMRGVQDHALAGEPVDRWRFESR